MGGNEQRVALVTGGNKGIGFEIARSLVSSGFVVILTARDVERGAAAASSIGCTFQQLDLDKPSTIDECTSFVRQSGGLDVLVNNAGMAFKGADPTPFAQQAQPTIATNYFGTLAVCDALAPLVHDGGHIVNVASLTGHLRILKSKELRDEFATAGELGGMTIDRLSALLKDFVASAERGAHTQEGWPNTCYGTSKLGVIAMTKIYASKLEPRGIAVNCMCPGYCATDMSSHRGPRSAAQGADTAVWLAGLPAAQRPSGMFFKDRAPVEW